MAQDVNYEQFRDKFYTPIHRDILFSQILEK